MKTYLMTGLRDPWGFAPPLLQSYEVLIKWLKNDFPYLTVAIECYKKSQSDS